MENILGFVLLCHEVERNNYSKITYHWLKDDKLSIIKHFGTKDSYFTSHREPEQANATVTIPKFEVSMDVSNLCTCLCDQLLNEVCTSLNRNVVILGGFHQQLSHSFDYEAESTSYCNDTIAWACFTASDSYDSDIIDGSDDPTEMDSDTDHSFPSIIISELLVLVIVTIVALTVFWITPHEAFRPYNETGPVATQPTMSCSIPYRNLPDYYKNNVITSYKSPLFDKETTIVHSEAGCFLVSLPTIEQKKIILDSFKVTSFTRYSARVTNTELVIGLSKSEAFKTSCSTAMKVTDSINMNYLYNSVPSTSFSKVISLGIPSGFSPPLKYHNSVTELE